MCFDNEANELGLYKIYFWIFITPGPELPTRSYEDSVMSNFTNKLGIYSYLDKLGTQKCRVNSNSCRQLELSSD